MSDADPIQIITAAWVAPITGPVIRQGAIAFQNQKISGVGTVEDVRAAFAGAPTTDLGDSILLPGLVNAHVHLDMSKTARPLAPPASFVDWVSYVITDSLRDVNSIARYYPALIAGLRQCDKFGVTSVGDIGSRQMPVMRATIDATAHVRGTHYGEITAMASRRGLLEERIATVLAGKIALETLTVGISPHAPYSIEPAGYRRCLAVARRENLPLATHLAETPYEAEFLATHTGPFRDLWDWIGGWDDQVPTFTGGPIRYAKSLGLLDYPTLLAHVNYCDDDELAILAAGQASVVYCPRTHAYFGHPPHRWRDMLAHGINVALGTDSVASSPDLNVLDDLRLVHRLAPDVPVDELWRLITVNGAKAICRTDVGSLSVGNWADVVAFPVKGSDPLREVLETDVTPTGVWIGGERK